MEMPHWKEFDAQAGLCLIFLLLNLRLWIWKVFHRRGSHIDPGIWSL